MNTNAASDWFARRRKLLAIMGATGTSLLTGFPLRNALAANAVEPTCVATPEQTEGPYFVDERLQRSDIRRDPSDGSIKEGVPLTLQLVVSTVGANGCKPLAGAIVDVWHCDAKGVYSDVSDPGFTTGGKKFLRGYQITDAEGRVRFTTIYPGWYEGRTVHIHFKIRTDAASARAHEFTSQLYFDDALNDKVLSRPPYAARGLRRVRNERDGIFRRGGRQLMLAVAESGQGYSGAFHVGLKLA
ncbi:twin-arginine translocation pathway signal protein [Noviherbaspirillum cavernae]|uniref:Twin-arginine translocation pathway signal protein n=1 Tax=Noviherbaspirillum cavernae TaxID=2320862 RepID=A0A418X685_9BURK|nr:intradiol ring-cleavage dioxygenase [Noviherbaspirillum cavernae]RJG07950.1 twin-arginine translocation pathway signal protein [Noviherbaspirillum cavernae]